MSVLMYTIAACSTRRQSTDSSARGEHRRKGPLSVSAEYGAWKARVVGSLASTPVWACARHASSSLWVVCQLRSSEDHGCGRSAPIAKIKTEGRQQDSLPRRSLSGGLSPCLGQAATGQDAGRVRRAGARSGRRKSCWARPDSCAGYWCSSRAPAWGARAACRTPLPSEGTAAGRAAARRLTPCRL